MTTTIKCSRCSVTVPIDKIAMKDRCLLKSCPLNIMKRDEDGNQIGSGMDRKAP